MGVVVVVGELPPPTKKMETMPGCHHHHDAVKVYVSSFVVALHAETKHIFLHPSLPASQLDGSLCKEQRWPPRATVGPIPPPIAHTSTAPALQTTAAPTATSLCPYGQCPPLCNIAQHKSACVPCAPHPTTTPSSVPSRRACEVPLITASEGQRVAATADPASFLT